MRRYSGWFLPWYIGDFYPQADLAPGGLGAIKWDCWLVKTLNKAACKLVLGIYALPRWIAMPQNGAALWIVWITKHLATSNGAIRFCEIPQVA